MKAEEVKYFYKLAGQTYRKDPIEGESKSWIDVLAFYQYSELDAAWKRWINDATIEEWTQRPRGSRMPTAADLKHSIEHFRSVEDAKKNSFVACGKGGCIDGWIPLPDPNKKLTHRVRRCECFKEYAMARQA